MSYGLHEPNQFALICVELSVMSRERVAKERRGTRTLMKHDTESRVRRVVVHQEHLVKIQKLQHRTRRPSKLVIVPRKPQEAM